MIRRKLLAGACFAMFAFAAALHSQASQPVAVRAGQIV